ncbi:hypothetical protein [Streptomyces sp. SID3343]|uniref:hypothetical protein n=1 Tax=Streptomyces sp. SID3343 TaxID=2690260 RepID=UPI00192607AE|nr:hypothetical protein [Streptomyces sp. SID3343]
MALVSDDEIAHRRALDRYLRSVRDAREARRAYDTLLMRVPRSVSAEDAAWERYRAAWLRTPAVALLAERIAPEDVPTWDRLPYALAYLEWEARFPGEWTRHAKVWSTKQHLIRRLAVPGHEPATRARLVDLVERVVNRRHRCKDREYSRVARMVDGPDLRERLEIARCSGEPWARDQAGHVLWLLRNPDVAINRANWFRWLAVHGTTGGRAACPDEKPDPETDLGPDVDDLDGLTPDADDLDDLAPDVDDLDNLAPDAAPGTAPTEADPDRPPPAGPSREAPTEPPVDPPTGPGPNLP